MSAETDYRALLAAHAPLTALVGTRIAENSIPKPPAEGEALVVFVSTHEPQYGTANNLQAERVVFATQCWAHTKLQAAAVAAAVRGAIAANGDYLVIGEEGAFEEDYRLDGVVLTVDRFL